MLIINRLQRPNQAAAVGPNARATNVSLTQAEASVDFDMLLSQLSELRRAMKEQAVTAGEDMAVGAIAAAEAAAKNADKKGTLHYLASAGKWALSISEKVGTEIATAAIKSSIGLP